MQALLLVAVLAAQGTDQNPLALDRTGLVWTLPFEAARERSEAEKRLLMIKPVAFGTTPDGGW